MKNLKPLMLLLAMLTMQITFAQNTSRLKFSNPYPERNEKITFTYDVTPDLAKVGGKVEGTAWFIEDTGYPSTPITIQGDDKTVKGEFSVSPGARAFFIKINKGTTIDNNDGKGFISLVYKDQKPLEGAYASNAFILASGIGTSYAKIIRSTDDAVVLYKKEFELFPQSEKKYSNNYYTFLAANPANIGLVNKKIAELQKSAEENDFLFAMNLLRASGQTSGIDSLTKLAKIKFPMGRAAIGEDVGVIGKEKDPVKKDSLFKAFLVKYNNAAANLKEPVIVNMLGGYLKSGDTKSYEKYSAMVTNKELIIMTLNNTSYNWAVAGERLAEAEKLSKQTIDIILSKAGIISLSDITKTNVPQFAMFGDTYAYILWKEGKFDEAVKYQSVVYKLGSDSREVVEHYVQMLNSAKDHKQALEVAEKSIRKGQTSDAIEQEFKTAYQKVKGDMGGFDTYWADVQKANNEKKELEKKAFEVQQKEVLANATSANNLQQLAKVKKDLSSKIIKEAAPLFTLKDLDGKVVSLASLKGKTVIIDFWATWCGPCIMSFPGMQIAQNKYKSNPDVVFLFIDTWENGTNYLPGVKKFVAEKGYSFHVLVDEMGADKRQSKVISTYKVDGIPTKFIIDKNGDIRFKYIGYTGSTEGVVNEVTAMIELLDDPIAKSNTTAPGTAPAGVKPPAAPSLNK
ncbi:redoxin family protein [Mucilaginibacter calamicampi]|uniref:Redoxin family protein n=1 Tax=Mucilaginibacter calamicampi TaxID=1302352 RepID=A0ABW2YUK9_9SPHI